MRRWDRSFAKLITPCVMPFLLIAADARAALFTWNGGTSNSWVDATQWSAGSPNFSAFPGDTFEIGGGPAALTSTSNFNAQLSLLAGGTLNLNASRAANQLHLAGGTLNVTTSGPTLSGTALYADTGFTSSLNVNATSNFLLSSQLNGGGVINISNVANSQTWLTNNSRTSTTFSDGTLNVQSGGVLVTAGLTADGSGNFATPLHGSTVNVLSGGKFLNSSSNAGFSNGVVNIKPGGVYETSNTASRSLNLHVQGGSIQSTGANSVIGDQTRYSAVTLDSDSSLGGSQSTNLRATLNGLAGVAVNFNSTSQILTLQQPASAAATYRGNWDIQQGQITLAAAVGPGNSTYHLGSGSTIHIAGGSQLNFGDIGVATWNIQHTITGNGTLTRTGSNSTIGLIGGGLSPASGSGAGTLSVTGPLSLSNGATYTAHLNGTSPGTGHDQLSVGGNVNLSGATLSALLGGAYTPAGGDNLVLLQRTSGSSITGSFNGYANGSTVNLGNYAATINYSSNQVTLSGFTAVGTPNLYHWQGADGDAWNNANNWTVDRAGTVPTGATPTATSDVLLSISSAAGNAPALHTATTLGQDFTMRGLTISGNTSAGNSVSVAAGNKLTLGVGGITVERDAPAATVQADIDQSAAQTWTNNGTVNPLTISGDVNNGGNLLTLAGMGPIAISGQLSGAGGMTTTNRGTVSLSGPNSYSGTTTVSNGLLVVEHASALGDTSNGTTVASGAALGIAGNITTAEPLTLNGLGINSDGALRNISGNNTFTGPITLATISRINSDSGTLTLDVAAGNAVTSANHRLSVGGSGNMVILDPVSLGTGFLTKDGTGTLTLVAANTYSGATNIDQGTLKIDFAAPGAPTSDIINSSSGAALSASRFEILGKPGTVNSQSLGSIGISPGSSEIAITSGASGTMNVVFAGIFGRNVGSTVHFELPDSGTVNTSGMGTSPIGAWATVGSGTNTRYATGNNISPFTGGTAAASADNFTSSSAHYNFSTSVPTNLTLSRMGNTARYTGSGNTITLAGSSITLTLNGLLNAGTGAIIIQRSGTNQSMAISSSTNELFLNTASSDINVLLPISGGGSLIKAGPGTLTLDAANTYTLQTYVNGGILSINANDRLGPSSLAQTLNLSNGTLQATATFALANTDGLNRRPINIAGNGGTIDVTGSNTLTVPGLISGLGSLTKTNSGTLVLGSSNTYSGGTVINGGTLRLGLTNALPVAGDVTLGGGTLDLGNYDSTIDSLSGNGTIDQSFAGTATLTLGASDGNGTFSGALVNTGGTLNLAKVGTGTQILSGASTYSGTTIVHQGILTVQNGTALGTSTGTAATGTTVHAGATLQLQGTSIGNEALRLHGAGAGGQNGSLVNVSGSNSYAGLITLGSDVTIASDAGTLAVTNAGAITGSGFGLVLTGAGNGSIASDIATGAAPLTKSGGGTWTLTGDNSYSGPTNITGGTLAINGTHELAGAPAVGLYTVYNGATLAGSGSTDGQVVLRGGSTISPGNSPGELTTAAETWNPGANFLFEINDAAGAPGNVGSGWDLLTVDGSLNLSGLSAGSEMNILLTSLTSGNVAGPAANFNAASDYAWLFADASSPIATYSAADQFDVDAGAFANPYNGVFSVLPGSDPAVLALTSGTSNSSQLYLVYQSNEAAVVPEPATWAMGASGLLGCLLMARRSHLQRRAAGPDGLAAERPL